jgi:hypothetical protein
MDGRWLAASDRREIKESPITCAPCKFRGQKVNIIKQWKNSVQRSMEGTIMARVESCGVCSGKGYVRCPICNGKGKINKGTNTLNLNIKVFAVGDEAVDCQSCQGIGRLLCKVCGGAGKILIEKPGSTDLRPVA